MNPRGANEMETSSPLPWEDYFMAVACLTALRSKDPKTKVGACIVNEERRIVALGYNGMPNGCHDRDMPWKGQGHWTDTKHPYVCHAEMNAIVNGISGVGVKGGTLYTTLFPCNECAKLIIQAGIRKVCYLSDKHHDKPATVAARNMFDMVGLQYRQHCPDRKVVINFSEIYGKSESQYKDDEDDDSNIDGSPKKKTKAQ